MTRLLLIRHGTNDLQESGILAGWRPGVHLNQKGRADADPEANYFTFGREQQFFPSPTPPAAKSPGRWCKVKPHHDTSAMGPLLAMPVLLVRLRRRFHVHDGSAGGLSGRSRLWGLDQRRLDVAVHRGLPTQVGPLV